MLTFIGYIPLRRGLLQHLHDGRLTPAEFNLYVTLLMWADHRTGIATTNATGLVFLSGDQFDLKYTRKCLASLEEKGYIKRPFFVQGQRGDQQMFIDKFVVTDGVLKGKVLSFADTTDWKNPAYVEISEEGSGKGSEEGSGKGSGNAPSNKKLKTEKEEVRQKKSGFQHAQDGQEPVDSRHVDKHQEQPQELQASLDQLSAQEQHQEQAPVQPPVGSYDFQDLAPIKKPYRSWEQLRQLWWDFRYEVEDLKIPGGNVASWGQPDGTDFRDFLNETDDSLEDIMNVARWGAVKSKHWFKPGKGQIDGFTGFRNAYAAMAKQHQNYKIKSQGATV